MKIEDFYIDFDSLKVGDKLWDIAQGPVVVTQLGREDNDDYPIVVVADNNQEQLIYTASGRYMIRHISPLLFKSNPFEHLGGFQVREMWVKDFFHDEWNKSLVVTKHGDKFVAVSICKENLYISWDEAKEIEPELSETENLAKKLQDIEALIAEKRDEIGDSILKIIKGS
jgi:hypothetical protein